MHTLKREIKEKVSIDFEKPRHEGDYGTKIESLFYSLALTLKDWIPQGFCNVFKCLNAISAHALYRFIGTDHFYQKSVVYGYVFFASHLQKDYGLSRVFLI